MFLSLWFFCHKKPFRAYTGEGNAGSWTADTGRGAAGNFGADAQMLTWITGITSGPFGISKNAKGTARSSSTYSGEYLMNFDLSRVWSEHAGVEFAPVHIRLPVILYLGQAA
ncbi:hypothetical protein [uncultured Bilophila sp.]|uniref:hypothetical protein n=2 Tax=uncultured Bilophila sp. TaxID=529385 RepID=UPI002609918E|nr:hypothetical protein [uncultured Bilophila sp.]